MHLTPEHLGLLKSIQDEWNRAEADIKTAEIVGINIVIPAVKELRYGGRRIIDAVMEITANPDSPNADKIKALLEDAHFDCHRARHDAIDAATSKIAADLEIMTKKLGYEAILPAYSEFSVLYTDLVRVRRKIVESREHRESREAIYSVIESVDFPKLVARFDDMRTCEPMMKALASTHRRHNFYGRYGLIIGVACLLIGLVAVGVAFWPSIEPLLPNWAGGHH